MDRLRVVKRGLLIGVLLLGIGWPRQGDAQLSPGPLHQVHADLEGPQKCVRCHTPRQGVDPDKCLRCHTVLQARIQAGKGLHAKPDFRRCERCHVEHQGRRAALIWWGDSGRAAFDHTLTGYPLRGKHAEIQDCRKCHRSTMIPEPQPLIEAHKDLDRTFLGLRPACVSCHKDPHDGQFGNRACSSCHTEKDWHQPEKFRHDRTRFPLTGKHRGVACRKCHKMVQGRVQFAHVPFDRCDRCHTSPHRQDMGKPCRACHTTRGWRVHQGEFDHDLTAFPLRGAHTKVACAQCHPAGQPLRATPGTCAGCHTDVHLGQFRPARCDRCHTEQSFRLPRFSVRDHDTTRFPLKGAHRAVPCIQCHRETTPDTFALLTGLPVPARLDTLQLRVFRWKEHRCETCHADPHGGEFSRRFAACTTCHTTETWTRVTFDHDHDAAFALKGAHRKVACAACHTTLQRSPRPRPLRLDGIPTRCEGCHARKEDPS